MTEFLKQNPVIVGALIATVPLLITSLVQIILHISETREKRREARIQSREKWIERDILLVMEALEKIVALLSQRRSTDYELQTLIKGKDAGLLTEEEYTAKAKTLYEKFSSRFTEINLYSDVVSRLVYSFDEDKIVSAYQSFVKILGAYMTPIIDSNPNDESNVESIGWILVARQAGEFQKALRNKLVSLRDS